MLILPENKKALSIDGNLVKNILTYPAIKKANSEFLRSKSTGTISSNTPSVCVLQGEQACVKTFSDDFVIGSVDATTCVIVVIVSKIQKWAWASHFDSCQLNDKLKIYPDAFYEPSDANYDIYIVGGFSDEREISLRICWSLLSFFCKIPMRLTIRLACILENNTDKIGGKPLALNLAVRPRDGKCSPAFFEDRGPEVVRRMSYRLICSLNATIHEALNRRKKMQELNSENDNCTNMSDFASSIPNTPNEFRFPHFPISVFDTEKSHFFLPGFQIPRLDYCNGVRARLEDDLTMSDEDFLNTNSTSPEFEPPHFVADIKATRSYVLNLDSSLEHGIGETDSGLVMGSEYAMVETKEGEGEDRKAERGERKSLWRKVK